MKRRLKAIMDRAKIRDGYSRTDGDPSQRESRREATLMRMWFRMATVLVGKSTLSCTDSRDNHLTDVFVRHISHAPLLKGNDWVIVPQQATSPPLSSALVTECGTRELPWYTYKSLHHFYIQPTFWIEYHGSNLTYTIGQLRRRQLEQWQHKPEFQQQHLQYV